MLVIISTAITLIPNRVVSTTPPPTDAWQTITIDNSERFPFTKNGSHNAIVFNDELHLLSDGSILINITNYP